MKNRELLTPGALSVVAGILYGLSSIFIYGYVIISALRDPFVFTMLLDSYDSLQIGSYYLWVEIAGISLLSAWVCYCSWVALRDKYNLYNTLFALSTAVLLISNVVWLTGAISIEQVLNIWAFGVFLLLDVIHAVLLVVLGVLLFKNNSSQQENLTDRDKEIQKAAKITSGLIILFLPVITIVTVYTLQTEVSMFAFISSIFVINLFILWLARVRDATRFAGLCILLLTLEVVLLGLFFAIAPCMYGVADGLCMLMGVFIITFWAPVLAAIGAVVFLIGFWLCRKSGEGVCEPVRAKDIWLLLLMALVAGVITASVSWDYMDLSTNRHGSQNNNEEMSVEEVVDSLFENTRVASSEIFNFSALYPESFVVTQLIKGNNNMYLTVSSEIPGNKGYIIFHRIDSGAPPLQYNLELVKDENIMLGDIDVHHRAYVPKKDRRAIHYQDFFEFVYNGHNHVVATQSFVYGDASSQARRAPQEANLVARRVIESLGSYNMRGNSGAIVETISLDKAMRILDDSSQIATDIEITDSVFSARKSPRAKDTTWAVVEKYSDFNEWYYINVFEFDPVKENVSHEIGTFGIHKATGELVKVR